MFVGKDFLFLCRGRMMKKVSYIEDLVQWKKEFEFCTSTTVRFSETDLFGHMNNVSPFIYFEEARIAFLQEIGLFRDLREAIGIPIVADLQCDYDKQLFFNEMIRIFVKPAHIGSTSFDLHYMVINEAGEVVLTGRGRMVYVNQTTGKPMELNEQMKDQLREYMSTD